MKTLESDVCEELDRIKDALGHIESPTVRNELRSQQHQLLIAAGLFEIAAALRGETPRESEGC